MCNPTLTSTDKVKGLILTKYDTTVLLVTSQGIAFTIIIKEVSYINMYSMKLLFLIWVIQKSCNLSVIGVNIMQITWTAAHC